MANTKFLMRFTWCDLDPIFTTIKSAQAVFGIHHHTKFENDNVKTVQARLLTNRQADKQMDTITFYLPLGEE